MVEMRDAVRAALGAWCILVTSGCGTSSSEVAALRNEIKELRKTLADTNGPPPPTEDRIKLAKEVEAKLQAKVDAEMRQENLERSTSGKKTLEAAALEADKVTRTDGGTAPSSSTVTAFNCYATICKGTSTHANEEAYRAFLTTAFGAGPNRYRSWFNVTRVDRAGTGTRTAVFYTGVAQGTPRPSPSPVEKEKGAK
jgi:hypothetical protein